MPKQVEALMGTGEEGAGQQKRVPKWVWWVYAVIGLVLLGAVLPKEQKHQAKQPAPASKPQEPTKPKEPSLATFPGQVGWLVEGTNSTVLLARTKEGLDQLAKAIAAGDDIGFKALILAGCCFDVPKGTKVKVIDTGWFVSQVRVQEGPYAGIAGWVSQERVRAVP
jgi:hypothetical protein